MSQTVAFLCKHCEGGGCKVCAGRGTILTTLTLAQVPK